MFTRRLQTVAGLLSCLACALLATAADAPRYDYRVLATQKTSTMEKEMNEAGDAGFDFQAVMGGETAIGGKEVVVVMIKQTGATAKKRFKLLATSKTSTMEKELQQAGDEGFEYLGQTVFQSGIAGREVAVILGRDTEGARQRIEYKLLATSKTSTMQKELQALGDAGFRSVGLTVAKTAFAGSELVCILRRNGQ